MTAPSRGGPLRLRHVGPGPLVSMALFEGSALLGALLAFAELTSWWAVVGLPTAIGLTLKASDHVAARLAGPDHPDHKGVDHQEA